MKRLPQAALVCAGAVSRTALARLPNLRNHLGPVLSGSLRVSSRTVNVIGGGWAVASYEDLWTADIIIISVPDTAAETTVKHLAGVKFPWKNRRVILVDSSRDSAILDPLHARGAATGSFNFIDHVDGSRVLMEGHTAAISAMKVLVDRAGTRSVQVNRGGKTLYLAGLDLAASAMIPLLQAASQALRLAGIQSREADALVAGAALRTVGGFSKSQRRAWLPERSAGIEARAGALAQKSEPLAKFYRQILGAGVDSMANVS
ncbi:MAG TPA: hypothetical protein VMZ52_08505 [Bryobacteraceae bacterium]|nr:hypothetical protein [Bryobacteraceae bacterium]